MTFSGEYGDAEWQEAAGHHPLSALDEPQVALLHRHWMWANIQRDAFRKRSEPLDFENLGDKGVCAIFLWYSLLWSVIEGVEERGVDIRGRFAEDIEAIADPLRRCRNAVFHISRDKYYDKRLFEIMEEPDSVSRIWRVSTGFGRLFLEEGARRRST